MNENISDLFNEWFSKRLEDVHTVLPGRIEKYDGHTTRRARVKPLVKFRPRDGEPVTIPAIEGIPVVFPSSSTAEILFDLERGDGVLILFSEAAIGKFLESRTDVEPETSDRFRLTDAIAIPGLWSFRSAPLATPVAPMQIVMSKTGITLKTGDATPWLPNVLAVDPLTGVPHGGPTAGVIKLRGA